jgi:hypothetical protein
MKNRWEIWSIIVLESLFGLCAASVIVYRVLGIAFDFDFLSYRVANISVSILLVVYLVFALLQSRKNTLIWVAIFSLFHLIEGVIIHFWFKVVIHALILVIVGVYYYRRRVLIMGN